MQTSYIKQYKIKDFQKLFWIIILSIQGILAQQTPVSINGQLQVCGTQLCNQYNKPIQLRGMSTHGIQWYGWGNCLTESSLDALAYDWDADVLRISLYVQEGGYETDPVGFTNQVSRLINEATERGMYALVDWHQLNPGDPNANLDNAKRFFTDIATLHKNKNNIIYDVCNEPNGTGVNWNRIKNYADQIIPVIQGIDNDAVVLVGTHGWSTFGVSGEGSLQDVIDNPLQFDNVMYTFHFYAKSHREAYLNMLDQASNRLPVFVTEFGSQEYTGDGPNDFVMTQQFIDLMRQKKISWTSWNYSDDFRSGAVWQTGTCSGGPWTTNRLKEAGSWIRDKIKFPADDFPDGGDGTTQTPYGGTAATVPGIVEVENYDLGAQSVAFNDATSSNQGGTYRNDAVDIEPCSEGGYNIGWIQTGEWLEYTINVLETKTYTLACRIAAISSGKTFHLEINNQNISGSIDVPNTGGWQNWQTVISNVALTKGQQILRIVMDTGDFNLDRLEFSNAGTPTNQPPVCSIVTPADNQIFEEGSPVTITANALDSDGSITEVAFFRNSTLIGTDTSAPYEYVIASIEEGTYSLTIKAYDDQGAFTSSSPVSITAKRPGGGDACSSLQYTDGITYNAGDKVLNQGKEYECLVGGWCSIGGPYEPGIGWAWPNAWKEIGNCSTRVSSLHSIKQSDRTICDVAPYQDGTAYQAGDEVQNFGKKYKCKVAGWCSLGGPYTPGGPDDWAWPSAWDELGSCDGETDNQLPVVTITSPEEGTQYQFGDEVTLQVNASDPDGSIAKVIYVVDGRIAGEDTTAPYEFSFIPESSGNHYLLAEAIDDKGLLNRSSGIGIFVIEPGDCGAEPYQDGNAYQTGDEVANLGYTYRCKVGGWCSAGGAYTPGGPEDWAWPLAWEKLGPCTGGNTPPEVTVLTPTIVYADELPVTVPFRVRAKDPDGVEFPVYVNVPGGALPLLPQGNDEYEADWSFSEYKTYTYTGIAADTQNAVTPFEIEITIKERIQGGDFFITKEEYNEFFPYRYGTDLATYELDPAKDFFTYESFVEAINRMSSIEVTFERRKGTNLYRLTRRDKRTNQSIVIRTDSDFDADWNQSKPIVTQVVDYEKFASEGDETTIKRELAAFLANISQETTGGWSTAPGGPYSWGLHFREEQGFEGTTNLGYRDEGNINYPPAAGKSYHGRGPIQLSWNYNYGQVSEFLFGDKTVLLTNPERIVQDAALAFQTAIWFWMTPQYPKPSAHDVMVGNWIPTTYDQDRNRKPGFGMTVNIINGGIECGKGTEINKVLGRIGFYERYTGILNINNDLDTTDDCSECGCATMQPFRGVEPEPETRSSISTLEENYKIKISVSPNPFENELRIAIQSDQKTQWSASLTDFKGHRMITIPGSEVTKAKTYILEDVSELPSGMYFLKIIIGKETKTFKIIKR